MTPLPLHGQVRPIKVEQDTWTSLDSNDEHSSHNISSTPPILRRKARKREAEDHEVGGPGKFDIKLAVCGEKAVFLPFVYRAIQHILNVL